MRLYSQKIAKKGQANKKAEFDEGDPRFQHSQFSIEYSGMPGLLAGVPFHLTNLLLQARKSCVSEIDSNQFLGGIAGNNKPKSVIFWIYIFEHQLAL